jgi:hypothetical protein
MDVASRATASRRQRSAGMSKRWAVAGASRASQACSRASARAMAGAIGQRVSSRSRLRARTIAVFIESACSVEGSSQLSATVENARAELA